MILIKKWERHLFRRIFLLFIFYLLGFFVVYSLIDLSLQIQKFHRNSLLSFEQIAIYYTCQFIHRIDLLAPLAFQIASMKTLLNMNQKNELLALQAGGLSLALIIRPVLLVAFCVVIFLFFNSQSLSPKAVSYIDKIETNYLKKKYTKDQYKFSVYRMEIEGNKQLIYQSFDPVSKEFFDVYLYVSIDEIWKMKFLSIKQDQPIGHYVDLLKRDAEGLIYKQNSYYEKEFPDLKIDFAFKKKKQKSFDTWPLSHLYQAILDHTNQDLYLLPKIQSQFYYKLIVAMSPLLIVIAFLPSCVIYHRIFADFGLYVLSFCGFITFFFSMNTALILGEQNIVPPYLALGLLPLLIIFGCFSRFIRTFYPG